MGDLADMELEIQEAALYVLELDEEDLFPPPQPQPLASTNKLWHALRLRLGVWVLTTAVRGLQWLWKEAR